MKNNNFDIFCKMDNILFTFPGYHGNHDIYNSFIHTFYQVLLSLVSTVTIKLFGSIYWVLKVTIPEIHKQIKFVILCTLMWFLSLVAKVTMIIVNSSPTKGTQCSKIAVNQLSDTENMSNGVAQSSVLCCAVHSCVI